MSSESSNEDEPALWNLIIAHTQSKSSKYLINKKFQNIIESPLTGYYIDNLLLPKFQSELNPEPFEESPNKNDLYAKLKSLYELFMNEHNDAERFINIIDKIHNSLTSNAQFETTSQTTTTATNITQTPQG